MEYEIRNPATAHTFFWCPAEQCWLDVIACGDFGVTDWIELFKRAGYCMCKLKGRKKR